MQQSAQVCSPRLRSSSIASPVTPRKVPARKGSPSRSSNGAADRAGGGHSCSSGHILHSLSPQPRHNPVTASCTCRNQMGKGRAAPWWFCAPHAPTSAMARAERHQLLCQLPTTLGQGWPAEFCSLVQEQWSHRHNRCNVQRCCPGELCFGLSLGVFEFIRVDAAVLYWSSASHSFSSASGVRQASLLLPSTCIAICKY